MNDNSKSTAGRLIYPVGRACLRVSVQEKSSIWVDGTVSESSSAEHAWISTTFKEWVTIPHVVNVIYVWITC